MMGISGGSGGEKNLLASQGCILGIVIAIFAGAVWLCWKIVKGVALGLWRTLSAVYRFAVKPRNRAAQEGGNG